jgi:glycosyltransferase involved in cell wall biosynthesis
MLGVMLSNNARKKVLFLITKSNFGGAQRYVYDLATHIDRSKFEPVVALGGNGELVTLLNHAGIRVITIKSLVRDISLTSELKFIQELAKIIYTERPDVFHVNSSKAGGIGTFLGRVLLVPKIIFTAHGWAFNEERPWWQKIITKILHYITVLLSHRTIAVSNAIVKQMSLPWAKSRMKVLYPGRTIGAMYEREGARDTLVQEFPPLEKYRDSQWIGSIAELHPIKQQSILIKSMAELIKKYPTLKLILIGEGSERKNLENLITKLQLSESVFLLGAISEAARVLKAFDIFALSSKSEAYGYVIHEAGLAQLPIVATRVGGIPEIITENISGLLVSPNSTTEFCMALDRLISNEDLQKTLAANLFQAMNKRSLEKMVLATEAIYTL